MRRAFVAILAINLRTFQSRSLASILASQFLIYLRQADRTMTGSTSSTSATDSQMGTPMQFFVATTEDLGQRTASGGLEEEEETPDELELDVIEPRTRD